MIDARPAAPVVRDAVPPDAAAIARVARSSWTETYRGIFDPAFIDEFISTNYAVESLAAAADAAADRDDAHFLVAERDGVVVAFAHFGPGPRGPELWRIYAHPDHFGTGVGSALLAELHRRLDGNVASYVLDVHVRNARGRAFYERHGFVPAEGGSAADDHLTLRRTLPPNDTTVQSPARRNDSTSSS